MNDILSLRGEVKQLQTLAQQLQPFVKSFATGVTAGEISTAASDAASHQHLQTLLDHLARLQMQDHQINAPTKDYRHQRNDNAAFMKGILYCIFKLFFCRVQQKNTYF